MCNPEVIRHAVADADKRLADLAGEVFEALINVTSDEETYPGADARAFEQSLRRCMNGVVDAGWLHSLASLPPGSYTKWATENQPRIVQRLELALKPWLRVTERGGLVFYRTEPTPRPVAFKIASLVETLSEIEESKPSDQAMRQWSKAREAWTRRAQQIERGVAVEVAKLVETWGRQLEPFIMRLLALQEQRGRLTVFKNIYWDEPLNRRWLRGVLGRARDTEEERLRLRREVGIELAREAA